MAKNMIRLGEVASYINGYAFKPEDRGNVGLPIIRIQDLTGNSYELGYYSGNYPQKIEINDGDILISWSASLGVYVWDKGKALLNQHIFKVEFMEDSIDKRYFVYAVRKKIDEMIRKSHGATMKHIVKKDFEDTLIPYPKLEVQSKIADELDGISEIIYMRKQQLKLYESLVRARFVELFGDLVEGDKIKTNRQKIGTIASVTKLAGFEFTKYIKYKDIGSRDDVIMLRGLNCKRGQLILDNIKWIDRETSNLLPRSKLYIGDILITYAGTIGDVALVDEDNKYHLAPNVGKITLVDKSKYNPVFLVHLLMYTNEYIMSFASKVAQASINMQKIRDFEYYFPNYEEQKYFANFATHVNKSKVVSQHTTSNPYIQNLNFAVKWL
jgi:hypothetical protein